MIRPVGTTPTGAANSTSSGAAQVDNPTWASDLFIRGALQPEVVAPPVLPAAAQTAPTMPPGFSTRNFAPPVNPTPKAWPNDPGAPVMTAGGMVRQSDPHNGSLFVSLPNGIVL